MSVITYERMALPADQPYDATSVGPRVHALREAMGLSLRELALRSGVSAAMLSQVERGETSPTLHVASRIAAGLELRLSQLLRLDESGAVTIVRAGEGSRRRGPGARAPLRGPDAPLPGQRLELSHHSLAPERGHRRRRRPADARARQPRDRVRRVRRRSRSPATGATTSSAAGDCVTFDADLPHHFANPGPDEARLLAVVSAGLRRS